MRRLSFATPGRAPVFAALLAVLFGAVATAAPAAATKASLRIVKLSPLTIRGSGFKPAERGTPRSARARREGRRAWPPRPASYGLGAQGEGHCLHPLYPPRGRVGRDEGHLQADGRGLVQARGGAGVHRHGRRPRRHDFRPGEKLSVNLVEGGGGHKKSATASAKGSFTVSFGALPMSDCTPYTLTITGSLGSRFAHTQEALPC